MIDYPASPALNQVFSAAGASWRWDGTKWVAYGGGSSGDVGRNLVHNPLMAVAQRGAGAFTTTASYTLDRWKLDFALDTSSVNALNVRGLTAVYADQSATQAMQVNVTGNAGASAFTVVSQYLEDVARLAGKTVTVSFYAHATAGTPQIGVSAQQIFGSGGSPSAAVLINGTPVTISTTDMRYSVTFAYPSIAGKTVGTNGDSSSRLALFFSSGATNNAFAGGIGVQSATFVLWGVQLEIGSVMTPLEKPDPQQDLAKCQRFYQFGTAGLTGYGSASGSNNYIIPLPVTMRASPTVSLSNQAYFNASGASAPAVSGRWIQFQATVTALGSFAFTADYAASADL